ncbi:hypothetical protein CHI96_00140 [Proteus mirabilis]|uniref:toll/interleukin-1 receptor domain-containing protein n=1 Tax=Proteus mirabilis TaxID=584 RepID=UPI000BA04F09|nr:toll/interleukin-1 receptor domain-containing protein [Proteus mirabilis]OZS67740.1 hypothetical protein CHI96_00140 [Proteus mirabilis]HCT8173680.1 toll/interleukin-1 receptor domain-containing protein [Proteus mirabilis]
MPIFISYSHEDRDFVDNFATQLVQNNIIVWMDRWELSIGDSIIDKVQDAVEGASALLVILSKNSVGSPWCKRELSAGLLRELEEKRVVVMPVLIEDCDIPLFARGKLYADFRKDFDDGLKTVLDGVAKVTNPNLNRAIKQEYHTDWSIDWGDIHGNITSILTFVEQAKDQPFTVLTQIEVISSYFANRKYIQTLSKLGEATAHLEIIAYLNEFLQKNNVKILLSSEREVTKIIKINNSMEDYEYILKIRSRRLGEDTGKDILVNIATLVSQSYNYMSDVLKKAN